MSELKKWKKKAWQAFSAYIRQKYANQDGLVECVTCNVVKPWKEMQAGHFIDSRCNSVLYNERLVYPQCFKCNMKTPGCLAGNKVKYTLFMLNTGHTKEWIENAENLKNKQVRMTAADHKEIFELYREWLK